MRALSPCLTLLLLAPCWAQTTTYTVSGKVGEQAVQGTLVVTRGAPPTARLQLAPGDWSRPTTPLRRDPNGWALPLPEARTPGLAGSLPFAGAQTQASPPRRWLLAGDPGAARFEVRLLAGSQVEGRLLALAPPPPQPRRVGPPDGPLGATAPRHKDTRRLLRNRWWSRFTVAEWGVMRAVWDALHGRSGAYLRGDVGPEPVAKLERALRRLPRPWSVATIYRTARAQTPDDKAALRLSFAFALDRPQAPVRPLRGIAPGEPNQDKFMHFFASAILAQRSNGAGSLAVGWLKEVKDALPGGSGYNPQDLTADVLGAAFGEALLVGEVLNP